MAKLLYIKIEDRAEAIRFPHKNHPYALLEEEDGPVLRFDGEDWLLDEEVLPVGQTEIIATGKRLELHVFHAQPLVYDLSESKYVTFGTETAADIRSTHLPEGLLQRTGTEGTAVLNVAEPFYLNGTKLEQTASVREGDEIFLAGTVLRYANQELVVWTHRDLQASLVQLPLVELGKKEQNFHRSPRIIHRPPAEPIAIAKPPHPTQENKQSLARLIIPPITMLVLLSFVYMLRPMGIYVIMMVGMSIVTIVMSMTSYFGKKKEQKQEQAKRTEQYKGYLTNKTKELYQASQEQAFALHYHYPAFAEIQKMVATKDRRLYEKTVMHHDFLSFQLGLGNQKTSFPLEYKEEDFIQNRDELYDQAQKIRDTFAEVKDVPIVTDLIHGPVAFIGGRDLVRNQLHDMLIQLATFHSYCDVQFIAAFREEELEEWQWMRWLPHSQIRSLNVRGFIYHQRSRDQILTSLYQIIKERKIANDQTQGQNQEVKYTPHYIFLLSELDLVMDHVIMEYLEEDLTPLGISLIFVEEVMESLPEHVQTVIDIRNPEQGNIVLQAGELVNQAFRPQAMIPSAEKEAFARQLAAINHVQNIKNAIPDTITFLEMYEVEEVNELNVRTRWRENEAYRTLAVPLGARGRKDYVYLNLHEKAHGPHGLIAGTTGSGKSELVQSYILSLAVNFHPYEVAFLLIDYKGGGMANLFKNLPHVVGTITNLDGAQAMRALVSIKAELQKRQRLFNELEVNHINQYHRLFKEGQAGTPMPHLFIISDEFAELKSEQPEFMKELVSTARIGRSLGIHLILATQKPSGVVDDQIWSNSKFKIALKVQNAADSNEVLKTPDAAQITQTGRAYLQVGNNEIYELFQSAWSGAPYHVKREEGQTADHTLYIINEKGQYEIISKDLSGLTQQPETKAQLTELEAVITEVAEQFDSLQQARVARPWLPPLEEIIPIQQVQPISFEEAWEQARNDIQVMIGMQDLPSLQAQEPLVFDLDRTGHFLIASSPGYGKSTFIQSFALDVMRKHSPAQAQFYLFDFGNNGLLPLLDFPHVADHFSLDETTKIEKAIRRLQEEIKRRKQALSTYKISNLTQYDQIAEEKIPRLIIAVDGYDAVRDSGFQEEFESMLAQLARDGISHGITLLITTNRVASIRMNIQANLKTKIGLYLFDRMDLNGLLGRSGHTAEEIPGRGMVKLDEIVSFQTFLPFETEQGLATIQAMKKEAARMDAHWTGPRPLPIPMMPEEVTPEQLAQRTNPTNLVQSGNFVVGLDQEEVQPAILDFTQPMILSSDKPAEIDRYQKIVQYNLQLLAEQAFTNVWDSSQELIDWRPYVTQYVTDRQELLASKQNLMNEIRTQEPGKGKQRSARYIVIPDLLRWVEAAAVTEEEIRELLVEGPKVGIVTVLIGNAAELLSGYGREAKSARTFISQALIGLRITDQEFERFPYIPREPYLQTGEAYIIKDQQYQKVQALDI